MLRQNHNLRIKVILKYNYKIGDILSSDQRVKKLRGSGGFVVATVTDEQQQVGNLGGPDLFLAPIGRIGPEQISKYFCNKCEKEHKDAPEINFENPNETVADNLILKERGKYVCKCGNVIAEYRQFEKPDEASEVGLAKPMDIESNVQTKPPQHTTVQSEEMQPNVTLETEHHSEAKMDSCSSTKGHSCGCSDGEQINSFIGRDVYDGASLIGKIRKIIVKSDCSITLVVKNDDGAKSFVPWNRIIGIGDIILLEKGSAQEKSVMSCSSCGVENAQGSKFCEGCGSSLS